MSTKGKVFKFGDNINTDAIISGRYKFSITDMKQLARYLFEDIRPGFYDAIQGQNPIIAAGVNFGMGSSREQAPWVIKEAGVLCVVAKSFARIFYRNAFNIGLALIEADTGALKEADTVDMDYRRGVIKISDGGVVNFKPWDNFREELIRRGGIINYLKQHKQFNLK